ncbi:hypothetical protein GN958_ATG23209 [Phytophthora infestans]|uniref:Secreted RxLR effector peptide protein n=1 Tax=Phytophthora infestans TaxID=4787 RepID=A0A8S9THC9_PHYIN|nr:hypothetical protein GN958_ATG23209 [Phytophthora infestans]
MSSLKLSLSFCIVFLTLFSAVCAAGTRDLTDSLSTSDDGISAPVVAVAAAAAVAVVILVTFKVRGSSRRPTDHELHEVVISPSQPTGQPMSTKKQFVYTAHI